jgi:glutamate-1-semialdehyde aminotransferase
MGNGFAVSALVGRADLMERGGLRTDAERVFLLSTTHGAESVGLAAAIATIDTYREHPVIEHMHRLGDRLARGTQAVVERHGIAAYLHTSGRPSNLVYRTLGPDGAPSQPYRTLFMQELVRNVEKLRDDWARATDAAKQKEIAVEIQRLAYDMVPYVNYGQWFLPTAYRSNLQGVIISPVPFFWNIEKE